ncbi:cold-shock protein [Streptomyces huiliensis]|uniref:cold-shock protein n=1 Tax=Streptomyces huiliensis TaxID=2876027 RepID=UPI001CBB0491|nr:cold shock domain-containing protein [Streptomyces huiliensis]MBZ4318337.1 cold shock domain-containing protein [Streptomyces huiliensis]
MVTGRIIRFDEFRGYGFVAPDTGGEDVFVHVNDVQADKRLIVPGAFVEFTVEEGERGLKASHVRLLDRVPSARPAEPPAEPYTPGPPHEDGDCDVLSAKEFTDEVTELLLGAAPTMTAEQILLIRQRLVRLAANHGWVEV